MYERFMQRFERLCEFEQQLFAELLHGSVGYAEQGDLQAGHEDVLGRLVWWMRGSGNAADGDVFGR